MGMLGFVSGFVVGKQGVYGKSYLSNMEKGGSLQFNKRPQKKFK